MMIICKAAEQIRQQLGERVLLEQLAEESAELTQAALKLIRAAEQINKTPINEREAREKLLEELADVELCAMVLGLSGVEQNSIKSKMREDKAQRWIKRLGEMGNK